MSVAEPRQARPVAGPVEIADELERRYGPERAWAAAQALKQIAIERFRYDALSEIQLAQKVLALRGLERR